MTATPTEPALDLGWFRHRFGVLAGQAQGWFCGGVALSLLGFSLPWFRHGASARWWYSGWQLWRNEGLDWIVALYLAYAALFLLGLFLIDRHVAGAAATLGLAGVVALGTLVVVAVGAGDALDGIRTMSRLQWSIGLAVLILGHATMLAAASAALTLAILGDLVAER